MRLNFIVFNWCCPLTKQNNDVERAENGDNNNAAQKSRQVFPSSHAIHEFIQKKLDTVEFRYSQVRQNTRILLPVKDDLNLNNLQKDPDCIKNEYLRLMKIISDHSTFDLPSNQLEKVFRYIEVKIGYSILHFATVVENTSNLEHLINAIPEKHRKEIINQKSATSKNGVSALHLAAQGSFPEGIDLLVAAGADVDQLDAHGKPPLYYAAIHKSTEAARCLIGHGAALNMLVREGRTKVTLLAYVLREVPTVEDAIWSQLDRATSSEDNTKNDTKFVKFDLTKWQLASENDPKLKYMDLLYVFAEEGDTKLIEHPLVRYMLDQCWQQAGNLFWFRLLFSLIFLIMITMYVLMKKKPKGLINCLLLFAVFDVIRKLVAFVLFAKRLTARRFKTTVLKYYFTYFDSYCQLVCIIGVLIFVFSEDEDLIKMIGPLVFLAAWVDFMILIGEVLPPALALHLDMYYCVIGKFVRILSAFSIFLAGFIVCFSMYFQRDENFSAWYLSVAKIFAMIVGELDYGKLVESAKNITDKPMPDEKSHYLIFPLFCIVIFIVAVPIILLSLLVGQVVDDISTIKCNALSLQLKRKAKQIEYLMSAYETIAWAVKVYILRKSPGNSNNFNLPSLPAEDGPVKKCLYSLHNRSLPDYFHEAYIIGNANHKSQLNSENKLEITKHQPSF